MISVFWFFLIYSFLGFLLEVAFAKWTNGKKQDRKCRVFFPICPVYGFGSLLLVSMPPLIQQNMALLFCFGCITASTTEYLTGIFYSRVLHVSFWDYRNIPHHLNGQICLPFSLIWGGLGILLVYGLHPFLSHLVAIIPNSLFLPIFYGFLADTTLSICILHHARSTVVLKWYDSVWEGSIVPWFRRIFSK